MSDSEETEKDRPDEAAPAVDDTDEELAEIRQRKAQRLQQTVESPADPVHVEGAEHFQELLAEQSPVLVDFYADWCGPCKQLEPIVDSIAAETDGTVA